MWRLQISLLNQLVKEAPARGGGADSSWMPGDTKLDFPEISCHNYGANLGHQFRSKTRNVVISGDVIIIDQDF